MTTKQKIGKGVQQSSPWLAAVLAVLGWLEARDLAKSAQHHVDRVEVHAEQGIEKATTADSRAEKAYKLIVAKFEEQDGRIAELEQLVKKVGRVSKPSPRLPVDYEMAQTVAPHEPLGGLLE